jgi:hypothetical protein
MSDTGILGNLDGCSGVRSFGFFNFGAVLFKDKPVTRDFIGNLTRKNTKSFKQVSISSFSIRHKKFRYEEKITVPNGRSRFYSGKTKRIPTFESWFVPVKTLNPYS